MMSHGESRLKIMQSRKVGGNTLEPEVVLMESDELKVSKLELQLIGKNLLVMLQSYLLSKNVDFITRNFHVELLIAYIS
jgi:hypothetical protein